jgi:hypothetical protein
MGQGPGFARNALQSPTRAGKKMMVIIMGAIAKSAKAVIAV